MSPARFYMLDCCVKIYLYRYKTRNAISISKWSETQACGRRVGVGVCQDSTFLAISVVCGLVFGGLLDGIKRACCD